MASCGKTSSQRFEGENMFTVFCVGKYVHRGFRGKTCPLSFAREDKFGKRVDNTSPASRSENHSTDVKFGENKFTVSNVANKSNLY